MNSAMRFTDDVPPGITLGRDRPRGLRSRVIQDRAWLRLGVAIALAAALLVGCAPSGAKTIYAEFADVGDLVNLASVQQSDAQVGSVRNIELIERDERWLARVELAIEPDTPTPQGMRATVRSTSLLGEKFVDLEIPEAAVGAPALTDGAVIGPELTGKAAELEAVLSQLGSILASGALQDLGAFVSATAMIVEGQEDNIGRVIDGTADLVSSLASQREAIASAVDDLTSSASTLADGSSVVDRALEVSDDALAIVADHREQIAELIGSLDRLAGPLGRLTREHRDDIDAQIEDLAVIVPQLHAARESLAASLEDLAPFTELFARAAPGDYIQLDIDVDIPDALLPLSSDMPSPMRAASVAEILWSPTR